MTKHNLKSNLSWLLQQSQCLHLPLEYSTVPIDEISSQHIYPVSKEEKVEHFGEAGARQIISKSLEAIGDESDYMARLQLATQTIPKPTLVTQQKVPSTFPTPADTMSKIEPPFSRGSVQSQPSSESRQTVPKTPTIKHDDIVFDGMSDVIDIDDLEFAASDHTKSSLDNYGLTKSIRTKEAASPSHPPPSKKGRKRKSDEYRDEAVSPQKSQRAAKRPLNAIPHYKGSPSAEYGSQPTIKARPVAEVGPAGQQTKAFRQSEQPDDSVDYDEEFRITETTIRTETRRSRSSTQLQRPGLHDITPPQQNFTLPKPSSKQLLVGSSRERTPKRIVEDSEDEFEDLSIQVKHEASPLRDMSFQPGSVDQDDRKIASSSPLKHAQHNTESAPLLDVATALIPKSSKNISPSKPSKVQGESSQLVPMTPVGKLAGHEKAYVTRFLAVEAARCDIFVDDLQKKKTKATGHMMIAIADGDDEDAVLECQRKISLIGSRITAVQALIEARKSYLMLLSRREGIKEKMHQLLEAGEELDPSKPDKEITKLYKSMKDSKLSIEEEERGIYNFLQKAGLENETQLINGSSSDKSFHNVQVGSTQTCPAEPLQQSNSTTTQFKDVLPSQRVAQTPVTLRRGPQADPPHVNDIASRGVGSQGHPSQDTSPRIQARDFSFVRTEPRDFTRTMGSPTPDFAITDEFDMDDADMLDAAEAFEQDLASAGPGKPPSGSYASTLAEMSANVRRPAPKADMYAPSTSKVAMKQYPWTKDVKDAMKRRFHLRGFRQNQLEAINATLDGKDAFVLMPTGGGKSLCYQLPSIVQSGKTQGITIVISPLISLMQDQVAHLQKLKIQAFLVNSECTAEHRNFVFEALSDPRVETFIELLYVTPEMLSKSQAMTSKFQALHRRNKLARIVIDEAHCVSQWGHDFRPDYKALGEWRKQFRGVPVMALTATATENVKYDVIHNLGMDGCDIFTQSFNRPNLTYSIIPKSKGNKILEDIASTIKKFYQGQSGIVYCLSRATCEKIAEKLEKEYGITAKHYHAGMESRERAEVQKQWQDGVYHVIVATIAFGMGIDKPDVRYVIHHSIPKSLEGYYQETGRAGRDGKRSGCYLYYGYGDTSSLKRMINDGEGSYEQKERQKAMLRQVVQFCENQSDCRRVQILGYFNERFEREDCKESCDNCQSDSTFETQDFSNYARGAIQLVRKVHKDKVTLIQCADILAGRAKSKKASDLGHDRLKEHGMGFDIDRGDLERVFQRLLSEDALTEYSVMTGMGFATAYIKLGPNYKDFENGRRPLKIQVRVKSPRGKIKDKAPGKQTARRRKGAEDYPASTNISSPIQPRSRAKLTRGKRVQENDLEEESDIDYFEPVREHGVPRRHTTKELGPPITTDEKMAKLNPTHRHIVEDFVVIAKKSLHAIVFKNSLRRQPVTDTQLREMGVTFPQNKQELLLIDGMDDDKVSRYGPLLLKLVKEAHNNYEAIMRAQEDKPDDPNHKNVVEISSDEENDFIDDEDELDMLQSDVEFDVAETSQYFSAPNAAVEHFNAQISQVPMLPAATSRNTSKKPANRSRASSSSSFRGDLHGRGGYQSRGRGVGREKGTGYSKKNKSTRSRKSNDSSVTGSFSRSNRGSGPPPGGRTGGGGGSVAGIFMMPT